METIEILGLVGLFAVLYSFADAWHDEKVIRKEKKWHAVDAGIKGMVSAFIGILIWIFTQDYILASIAFLGILVIRAGTFNFFINKLMEYDKGHRRKEGIDKIPTWIWWIVLLGLGVFSYLKYI